MTQEESSSGDDLTAKVRLRIPGSALAPFVYRMLLGRSRIVAPVAPAFRELLLPLAYSIFGYREFHPSPGKKKGKKELFLVGPQSRLFEEEGVPSEITTIVFKPGAARALMGVSATQVVDRHVLLSSLWGKEGRILEEKCFQERDLDKRMDLLEKALAGKLPPDPRMDLFVMESAAAIEEQKGKGSLEPFFTQTGYSRRQVLNQFNKSLGFSPKLFAQVVRLRNLFRSMDLKKEPDWARLAPESGYFDQAHLVREFRKLMGSTPARFAREFQQSGMFMPGTDNTVLLFRKNS